MGQNFCGEWQEDDGIRITPEEFLNGYSLDMEMTMIIIMGRERACARFRLRKNVLEQSEASACDWIWSQTGAFRLWHANPDND